jgi:hypothetical protein
MPRTEALQVVRVAVFLNILLAIELRSLHRIFAELLAAIRQDALLMQEIVDDDRTHRVELEIALRPCEGNRRIVAKHLNRNHHHSLALGRIDLPRHNRRPWLIGGQLQLSEGAARPDPNQRMWLAIFMSATARPRREACARTIASSDPER